MARKYRDIPYCLSTVRRNMWKHLLILLPLCACQQHVAVIGAAGTSPRVGVLPNDRELRDMLQAQVTATWKRFWRAWSALRRAGNGQPRRGHKTRSGSGKSTVSKGQQPGVDSCETVGAV